jgi:hypothetical protein
MKVNRALALIIAALFSYAAHAATITIPTVPIGNPGNAT